MEETLSQNRTETDFESQLKDEPDADIVSRWVAKEYGESSPEYYEAYSQELLRSKQLKKKAAEEKAKLESKEIQQN